MNKVGFCLQMQKTLKKVIKATNVLLRISDKGSKVTSQKVVDLDQLFTGKSSSISESLQSSYHFNGESHSECSSPLDMSSNSLDIGKKLSLLKNMTLFGHI